MTPRSSCPGGESTPLQGANLRLNYEINNVTDTALGNLARGKPSFCRSDRCLSYRPPGSLLESRGGSILARAEVFGGRSSRTCSIPARTFRRHNNSLVMPTSKRQPATTVVGKRRKGKL